MAYLFCLNLRAKNTRTSRLFYVGVLTRTHMFKQEKLSIKTHAGEIIRSARSSYTRCFGAPNELRRTFPRRQRLGRQRYLLTCREGDAKVTLSAAERPKLIAILIFCCSTIGCHALGSIEWHERGLHS